MWQTPIVYSRPCAVSWRSVHVPPALLSSTSRRSQRLRISSAALRTEARSARSSETVWTSSFQVRRMTSCAAASAFAWLRQASTVVAPWAATPTAVSSPTPELAPVMTTTLPCMLMLSHSLEVCPGILDQSSSSPPAGHSGDVIFSPEGTEEGGVTMTIAPSPPLDGLLLQVLVPPEGQADPYPSYAQMRSEARVSRTAFGPYVVNGYQECLGVLRDPRLGRGMGIEDTSTGIFSDAGTRRGEFLDASQHNMLMADPPDHTRLRRLVSRSFTPRQVDRLRPAIHQLVDGLLGAMAARGEVDFIA